MGGSGTTISSVLAGEQALAAGTANDTLEGATSGESPVFADFSASSDYFYWAVPRDPAPAEAGAPVDTGGPGSEGGDPRVGGDAGMDLHPSIGGASLVAGDALVYDGVRIAIGDWNDIDWSGTPWGIRPGFEKLPWMEGGDYWDNVIELPDVEGDGFGDVVPGDYGYYADGGEHSYDGYYDGYYGGYTITSAGDINGDGFEDYLVEGYGYSYVQYGGDYSYAGDGDYAHAGDGDYSYAGDGTGGPNGIAIEPGVIVFSPDWDWSSLSRLNIQVSGNAVLSWTSNNELVINVSGDGYVFIEAGDSQISIGTSDNDVVLNSLSSGNVRLTTAGVIGELNTFIVAD